jgi:PAS domain S-box-containing protein
MSEQHSASQQAATLRERAEKAFREMPDGSLEDFDALSPEALRASLHELRVHQIELEMQNMEMVREREARADLQARYFDLYDLAPVSYCTIGERGLILEANLTASTLLRVERGALVGRRLSDFISKEDQTPYYLCWKNLLDTREPQECDLRMLRHDGTAFFAHLNFTVARDKNGAPACLVALSDITGRKQAQEEILRINRELEEATAKAEKATAAKSEFLAIMSHEMRNPLTGILGFAELLADTPLTGEQQSCTEAIEESGAHLLSLINDVLDFSSIEKGALAIHPAPFDLAHLVKLSSDIVRKSAVPTVQSPDFNGLQKPFSDD